MTLSGSVGSTKERASLISAWKVERMQAYWIRKIGYHSQQLSYIHQ
jgi:hypothetical protein